MKKQPETPGASKKTALPDEVTALRKKLAGTFHELESIMSAISDIIYVIDLQGRLIKWNKAAETVTGYSPEELTGEEAITFFTREEQPLVSEAISKCISLGEAEVEAELLCSDGTLVPYHWKGVLVKNEEGAPVWITGVGRDISERRRTERMLREAETRYRTLFEQSPYGILLLDSNGVPVEFNEAVHSQLGYTREEFEGLRISDIDPVESEAQIHESIGDIMKTGKSQFEVKHRTKEGHIRDVQVIARKLTLSERDYLHVIWRDITDRKKMEEEFLKVEKLESLSVLAGGIAHDFNNLLVGILGHISLAKINMGEGNSAYEKLLEAEKACVLARGLTQQLLTFSRSGEPLKKTASVGEIVKDSCVFSLSGSNVKYVTVIPDDIHPVDVDAGQISQVMNNLIINADQAMPYGGTIHVECANVTITTEEDSVPLPPGAYVRISIRDQGAGIPADLLLKIFDPYFTTKQKGSGLGLATSYSVVKKHGGHMEVKSRLGLGTTFNIYLPACAENLPVMETTQEGPVSGHGRILLMDDEEIVRFVTANMLEQLGYEVETVSNGEDAIEVYHNAMMEERPFDAVITDLTVRGGMGGTETAEKLLETDPAVKTIVFSGYSDDPVTSNFRDYGFRGFLCKPCQIEELGAVLHDVLEDSRQ